MRVTAKAKEKTRGEILAVARNLFQKKGFSQTTTRDIASGARIATGTLFNYFPTKEELALAIVGCSLSEARAEFQGRRRGNETLDELLFAHVAAGLRSLRPHRGYVAEVLNTSLGPLAKTPASGEGEHIRKSLLETVKELIAPAEPPARPEPSAVDLHLYWTLFLGVLAYWAADESPHQEDTLVLLDHSMKLFVNSLTGEPGQTTEVTDGPTLG
jgi:AcrR family transcriptional regulator